MVVFFCLIITNTFFLDDLLEMLREVEVLLEHQLSSIPIGLFARLVDEKVFFRHANSR
jgi:hypothetical protein